MVGVNQRAPMEFFVEHTGQEEKLPSMGVDHFRADLSELPVAGEGEPNFVLPAAVLLGVIALPEEHVDIGALVLQGVDEVHHVGFNTAAIAIFPVVCYKCNPHSIHPNTLRAGRTHPWRPSRHSPMDIAQRT